MRSHPHSKEFGSDSPKHSCFSDQVYSLLFVDHDHCNNSNLRQEVAFSYYIACASLAATSARRAGINLTILTNNASALIEATRNQGVPAFKMREMAFNIELPKKIRYYQAHYKLNVLRAFGTGDFGGHPTLVDTDVFFQKDFRSKVTNRYLVAYDITYKAAHCDHDLSLLLPPRDSSDKRRWWAGGEFISGSATAFFELAKKIDELLPAYIGQLNSFIHVGDEALVSAALNLLTDDGAGVCDAGTELGIIARWHSSRTLIPQERFNGVRLRDVLHLPDDKAFLASKAIQSPDISTFQKSYELYARKKILMRAMVNPLLNIIKEKKFLPVV